MATRTVWTSALPPVVELPHDQGVTIKGGWNHHLIRFGPKSCYGFLTVPVAVRAASSGATLNRAAMGLHGCRTIAEAPTTAVVTPSFSRPYQQSTTEFLRCSFNARIEVGCVHRRQPRIAPVPDSHWLAPPSQDSGPLGKGLSTHLRLPR